MLMTQVFRYGDLGERGKKAAAIEYGNMLCSDSWWYQSVYEVIKEDGKNMGLDVDDIWFDMDAPLITIDATYTPEGEDWVGSVKAWDRGMRLDLEDVADDQYQATYDRFRYLVEDFCRQGMWKLRQEWEYLTSEEVMVEFFDANEWYFLPNGTVITNNVMEVAA